MPRHCSHRKGNLSQHLDINWFVFPAKAQLSLKHFCEGIAKKKILIKPIKTTTKKTLPNLFVCNCWSPVSEWSVYSYVGDRLRCTYGVIILVSHQLPHYYKPPFPLPNAKHTLYVASVFFCCSESHVFAFHTSFHCLLLAIYWHAHCCASHFVLFAALMSVINATDQQSTINDHRSTGSLFACWLSPRALQRLNFGRQPMVSATTTTRPHRQEQ